jgi:hypothetical protein
MWREYEVTGSRLGEKAPEASGQHVANPWFRCATVAREGKRGGWGGSDWRTDERYQRRKNLDQERARANVVTKKWIRK